MGDKVFSGKKFGDNLYFWKFPFHFLRKGGSPTLVGGIKVPGPKFFGGGKIREAPFFFKSFSSS